MSTRISRKFSILTQHMRQWLINIRISMYKRLEKYEWTNKYATRAMANIKMEDLISQFNVKQVALSKLLSQLGDETVREEDTVAQILRTLKNTKHVALQEKFLVSKKGNELFGIINDSRAKQAVLLKSIRACREEIEEIKEKKEGTDVLLRKLQGYSASNAVQSESEVVTENARKRERDIDDVLVKYAAQVVDTELDQLDGEDGQVYENSERAESREILRELVATINHRNGAAVATEDEDGENPESLKELRETVMGESSGAGVSSLSSSSTTKQIENNRLSLLLEFYGAAGSKNKRPHGRNSDSSVDVKGKNRVVGARNSNNNNNNSGPGVNPANALFMQDDIEEYYDDDEDNNNYDLTLSLIDKVKHYPKGDRNDALHFNI